MNTAHHKSKKRYTHPPPSSGMVSLLVKYTLLGSLLLGVFVLIHGTSPTAVFFTNSNSFSAEADLEDYPTYQVNTTDEQSERDAESILNSAEERSLERKEQQLARLARQKEAEKEIEDEDENNNPDDKFEEDMLLGVVKVEELGGLKFSDGKAYKHAEIIEVPGMLPDMEYKKLWNLQKFHDDFFIKNPHRRYIPRLAQPISKLEFHQIFRQTGTPVIIPFDMLRNHGFLTKAYTIQELRQIYPYTPPADGSVPLIYTPQSGKKEGLDLGPAIYALEQDMELMKAKGFKRNFPRNLMLKSKYLSQLEISYPPFVPKKRFQPPTLWFGTSTADTKLHSDCCDNFVQMLVGTKRWFIAPPTASRELTPIKCDGVHQSLCWAGVPYPNANPLPPNDKKKLDKSNSIVLDLKAGEMLYLPAGWWHHIENRGPTIMSNFWTYGCQNVATALDVDPLRQDRNDFKRCPAVSQEDAKFVYSDQ